MEKEREAEKEGEMNRSVFIRGGKQLAVFFCAKYRNIVSVSFHMPFFVYYFSGKVVGLK